MELGWRVATPSDKEFVRALFFELKSAEFAPLGLPPGLMQQMLEQQWRAREAGYQVATAYFLEGVGSIVLADGQPIHLVDITIHAAERGKGHGTRAIQSLIALGKGVRLQVEHANPARRLYERLGFLEAATDGFYVEMECGSILG